MCKREGRNLKTTSVFIWTVTPATPIGINPNSNFIIILLKFQNRSLDMNTVYISIHLTWFNHLAVYASIAPSLSTRLSLRDATLFLLFLISQWLLKSQCHIQISIVWTTKKWFKRNETRNWMKSSFWRNRNLHHMIRKQPMHLIIRQALARVCLMSRLRHFPRLLFRAKHQWSIKDGDTLNLYQTLLVSTHTVVWTKIFIAPTTDRLISFRLPQNTEQY